MLRLHGLVVSVETVHNDLDTTLQERLQVHELKLYECIVSWYADTGSLAGVVSRTINAARFGRSET